MKILKIRTTKRVKSLAFAFLMSFITSSIVSLIVVLSSQPLNEFFKFWFPSVIRAWPIVFVLIIIFVPFLNKFLDLFLDTRDIEEKE